MSAIQEPEDDLVLERLKGPGETPVNEKDAWTFLRRSAVSFCEVDHLAAALRSSGPLQTSEHSRRSRRISLHEVGWS